MEATLGSIPSTANDTENDDQSEKSLQVYHHIMFREREKRWGTVISRVIKTNQGEQRKAPFELLFVPASGERGLVHELYARHAIELCIRFYHNMMPASLLL